MQRVTFLKMLFWLACATLAAPQAARAQDTAPLISGDELRGPDVPHRRIKYGRHVDQAIRYSRRPSSQRPPLVILVGDQGWRGEVEHYPMHLLRSALWQQGYAFAAIDYRTTNRPDLESSLANIIAALRYLLEQSDELGFDSGRIVLIGNGPGAYFVTLLGTDPATHLDTRTAAAIKGVVSINGEIFDVRQRLREVNPFRRDILTRVFGEDAAHQARMSPARHLAAPNAPAFLFQAVSSNVQLQEQAYQMHELLRREGTAAGYAPLVPWRRELSNSYYGGQGNLGVHSLLEFLVRTVGPARPAG